MFIKSDELFRVMKKNLESNDTKEVFPNIINKIKEKEYILFDTIIKQMNVDSFQRITTCGININIYFDHLNDHWNSENMRPYVFSAVKQLNKKHRSFLGLTSSIKYTIVGESPYPLKTGKGHMFEINIKIKPGWLTPMPDIYY